MHDPITSFVLSAAGFIAGGLIGLGFGALQNAAREKNRKKQLEAKFGNPWIIIPGSMTRTALLIIVLCVVQSGLPLFFTGPVQWIVTAGVILGYGWVLLKGYKQGTTIPQQNGR